MVGSSVPRKARHVRTWTGGAGLKGSLPGAV
jgi:hypothetical protein